MAVSTSFQPDSSAVHRFAELLCRLGRIAYLRGSVLEAESLGQLALSLQRRMVPESLAVAATANLLGLVAWKRGRLDEAEGLLQEALELRQRHCPGTLEVAACLDNLGILASSRGGFDRSERYHRGALELREALAPASLEVSRTLNNFGIVLLGRGDLGAAEPLLHRARALAARLAPGGAEDAVGLNNLGKLSMERGDLRQAERHWRAALRMQEILAPESLEVARSLNNLSNVAQERGELAQARELLERALRIKMRLAPASLDVAYSLTNLGNLAQGEGQLAVAEDCYREALRLFENAAPRSPGTAQALLNLGQLRARAGSLTEAECLQLRALELLRDLGQDSMEEIEAHQALAQIARSRGQPEAEAAFQLRAIAALEARCTTIGGAQDVRTGFAARYGSLYREAIRLALDRGRLAEAFELLERSRARLLLRGLAEPRLTEAAEDGSGLWAERRRLEAEHRRLQGCLRRCNSSDARGFDDLFGQLLEARDRLADLQARLRRAFPDPGPSCRTLDLAGVHRTLRPGTLLLSYSVGSEETQLFALRGGGAAPDLAVHRIPAGETALRTEVRALRRLLMCGRLGAVGPRAWQAFEARSSSLYGLLLGPVREWIAAAQGLSICADGPLHALPFAALVSDEAPEPGGTRRYLIEAQPLHQSVSATLKSELRRRGVESRHQIEMAAFGDVRSFPEGCDLEPLPGTRHEVEILAQIFGANARIELGAAATKERAMEAAASARYLHLACHGLLDEALPLNSAIVLGPAEDSGEAEAEGLLQAWEILDRPCIGSELVTLSACETALGPEGGGEGLIGLARAFLSAGARSVLATLWKVDDRSTAAVMRVFYGLLAAGAAKDEALRQAQLQLIRGSGAAVHPFHWAPFVLIGDAN